MEEIKLYQEGKLDTARMEAIDTEAAQNPLLAEAMEGYAAVPVFTALPDFSPFLGGASSAISSVSAVAGAKAGIAWWSAKTLIVAVVVAASATTAIVLTRDKGIAEQSGKSVTSAENQSTETTPAENTKENNSLSEENGVTPTTEANSTTALSNQPSNNQSLVADGFIADASRSTNIDATVPSDQPAVIEPLKSIGNDNLTAADLATVPQTTEYVRTGLAAVGIQRILNYKVADYTKLRNNQWPSFGTEVGSVPAPFENDESRRQAEMENVFTTQIPYLEYLTQCMRAMDQKSFALAIQKLEVITQQYPDDVNAQFYTARCLYESGEFEKAIVYYDKSMKNAIRTFNEEAEFYKAKSLKALGREEEASNLFNAIVARGKFYAEKAMKELDKD